MQCPNMISKILDLSHSTAIVQSWICIHIYIFHDGARLPDLIPEEVRRHAKDRPSTKIYYMELNVRNGADGAFLCDNRI